MTVNEMCKKLQRELPHGYTVTLTVEKDLCSVFVEQWLDPHDDMDQCSEDDNVEAQMLEALRLCKASAEELS